MNEIKSIVSVPEEELRGKRVIVRCDFNVQVFEGKILDDLRIRKTLSTIQLLRKAGAKIILISHIESKDATGLRPIMEHINTTYTHECGTVQFIENFRDTESTAKSISNMHEGEVILFENLRIDSGEKNNDTDFAKMLASYADVYVNDAFSVSHRAHASVVQLPSLFPHARYMGVQLANELAHLRVAFNAPHPFVFILGGAKFETKLPLIQKFSQADSIVLGGALLNDILKAKGYNIGKSLVSSGLDTAGKKIDFNPIISNPKLIIPDDVVVFGPISKTETSTVETNVEMGVSIKSIEQVGDEDVIMDVGPSIHTKLASLLEDAKFILWNGPMGNYEKGFKDQTIEMAKLVVSACTRTDSPVQAVLGGGDTTAAVVELGLENDNDTRSFNADTHNINKTIFISTGGGAMLEYLLNETLPGVEALGC